MRPISCICHMVGAGKIKLHAFISQTLGSGDDLHHPAVYHRGDNILKLSHLIRVQCVQHHVGLCRDTNLDQLGE